MTALLAGAVSAGGIYAEEAARSSQMEEAVPAGQEVQSSPPAGRDLRNTIKTIFIEAALAEGNPYGEPLFPRPLRKLKPAPEEGTAREISVSSSAYRPDREEEPAATSLITAEVMENPLTQFYLRQYTSPGGLLWLSSVMERGGPYLAFIRKEITARKLPPELLFLPIVESGFVPTAESKSGAVGLWQFMKNSIAPFDIAVNDWIDERRDFWKSTEGALQKLEENYHYLGDWPLALAAYNAGLGAINRIIRQNGERNYFTLSRKKLLKNETIHYVPKLLAIAHILSNQRRYGMEPFWPDDPEWKRIPVERPVDLRILAEQSGVSGTELTRANRELLYYVTPPGRKYNLKVAGRDAEKITAVLGRNDIPLIRYYIHIIRSGDTLSALARHYGISVDQILASNAGLEPRFLRIGSRVLIPALKEAAPYVRPASAAGNFNFSGSHLVKKGETLWSIALAYEIDPEALAEANGMELNDVLREGRTLKTPIK